MRYGLIQSKQNVTKRLMNQPVLRMQVKNKYNFFPRYINFLTVKMNVHSNVENKQLPTFFFKYNINLVNVMQMCQGSG